MNCLFYLTSGRRRTASESSPRSRWARQAGGRGCGRVSEPLQLPALSGKLAQGTFRHFLPVRACPPSWKGGYMSLSQGLPVQRERERREKIPRGNCPWQNNYTFEDSLLDMTYGGIRSSHLSSTRRNFYNQRLFPMHRKQTKFYTSGREEDAGL